MRPQQAPLGEPTRDVALVHQGRVEERRLDYLYEAPQAPPGMAGGQVRGRDPVVEHTRGARASQQPVAISSERIRANTASVRVRRCNTTLYPTRCAAVAGSGARYDRRSVPRQGRTPLSVSAIPIRGLGRCAGAMRGFAGCGGADRRGLRIDRQVPRRLRGNALWPRDALMMLATCPSGRLHPDHVEHPAPIRGRDCRAWVAKTAPVELRAGSSGLR